MYQGFPCQLPADVFCFLYVPVLLPPAVASHLQSPDISLVISVFETELFSSENCLLLLGNSPYGGQYL